MHRANVLASLNKSQRDVMDVLRMKNDFREYARELAEKSGIKTSESYWSSNLNKKSPLIKEVRAILDLIREYITITNPKKAVDWKAMLTDYEAGKITELLQKMNSNNEVPAAPSVEDLLGQD